MHVRVEIPEATADALSELSIRERRDARDQAAVLLIQQLARLGLVSEDGLERTRQEAPLVAR